MRIKTFVAAAAMSTFAFGANAGGLLDEQVEVIPAPPVAPAQAGSSLPTWAIIAIGAGLVGLAAGSGS
ncbi:MAG: hypothetical protein HLUCCA08_10775 [Rhodobacteraceae bacterium HLUCCA08]|nr:MAG: hypothetical protein HLUCCA08_10775 [Rhodobacteraceae bacterium HLUCCA08]